MTKLLQLSLKAATFAARTSAQLVEAALDRIRGGAPSDETRWTSAPPPGRPATSRPPRAPRHPRTDDDAPLAAPVTPPPVPEPPAEPELGAVPAPLVAEPPIAAAPVEPPPVPPVAAVPDEPPIGEPPPLPPVAAVPDEPAVEPPLAEVPEPTPGQAARVRAQRREAETTAESPGAEVHVDEPWQGYASMNAPEIIDRLAVSDDAVKAIVLLYESSHRGRKTVLRAAGR